MNTVVSRVPAGPAELGRSILRDDSTDRSTRHDSHDWRKLHRQQRYLEAYELQVRDRLSDRETSRMLGIAESSWRYWRNRNGKEPVRDGYGRGCQECGRPFYRPGHGLGQGARMTHLCDPCSLKDWGKEMADEYRVLCLMMNGSGL